MKPSTNSIGVERLITPPHSVPTQEKILMPVGTAISSVEIMIGMRSQGGMPETNMWWAQTVKPSTPIEIVEKATAR